MILETIKNRRAVFPIQFSDAPIHKHEIEELLEAANWAPTHKRTEPWRFKVFHSIDSRKRLSNYFGDVYQRTTEKPSEMKLRKLVEKPLQSACVIAICMQRDDKERIPEWEEIATTAMAVQNMWLLAHEKNIGAYWSSPKWISELGEFIDLQVGERCLGFFFMGKFDVPLPEGNRNSTIESKTKWM